MSAADPWPLCPGVWERRRLSMAVLLVAVLAPAATSPRLHQLLVKPLALGLGLAWEWQWVLALQSERSGVPRHGLTTASL